MKDNELSLFVVCDNVEFYILHKLIV